MIVFTTGICFSRGVKLQMNHVKSQGCSTWEIGFARMFGSIEVAPIGQQNAGRRGRWFSQRGTQACWAGKNTMHNLVYTSLPYLIGNCNLAGGSIMSCCFICVCSLLFLCSPLLPLFKKIEPIHSWRFFLGGRWVAQTPTSYGSSTMGWKS